MVTSWEQVSAKMMSKNAQNCSKLLEIAQILSLASARKQTCVLTVCQQQHWQVFEHCSNSRIKASVGTKSVPTLDMSVQTFEREPWMADEAQTSGLWGHCCPCQCSTECRSALVCIGSVQGAWDRREPIPCSVRVVRSALPRLCVVQCSFYGYVGITHGLSL